MVSLPGADERDAAGPAASGDAPAARTLPDAATRVYVAVCIGLLGYLVTYLVVAFFDLPRLFYDPLGRGRFFFYTGSTPLGPLPTGYVGAWLWALLAGLLGAGAGWSATARPRTPVRRDTMLLLALWALGMLFVVTGYFVYQSWPR